MPPSAPPGARLSVVKVKADRNCARLSPKLAISDIGPDQVSENVPGPACLVEIVSAHPSA
jgi:hypothetical protein